MPKISKEYNKYKLFKNFMYNELGITKDDIKFWTKEAIREVAEDYVEHQLSPNNIRKMAENAVLDKDNFYRTKLKESLEKEIAVNLSKKINIDVSLKNDV